MSIEQSLEIIASCVLLFTGTTVLYLFISGCVDLFKKSKRHALEEAHDNARILHKEKELELAEARRDRWYDYASMYRNFTSNLMSFVERIQGTLDEYSQQEAEKLLDSIEADLERLMKKREDKEARIAELEKELAPAEKVK